MTLQPVELTEQEARRLTERIRSALDRVSTAWADLAERVHEAQERRADLALGYDSWAEYVETELKPPAGMAVEARRQLVGLLSGLGMSTRAIAPVVGVSQQAVVKTLRHPDVTTKLSPEPAERIDPATGEVLDLAPLAPEGKSLGLDGKTYTRPAPSAPRRRPLPDAFWDRVFDLGKRVDSLAALTEDDRFEANREAIADKNLHWMKETANTLARVLAAVEGKPSESLTT